MSGSDSSGIKNQFEPGHFVRNITSGIVEAYAQCQRKAFFLLQGKIEGREHEYFQILKERATANRLRFEASPEVGLKDIVDKKNDAPHVVKSGDMVADCDALLKSESGHLTLKTHAQYEPCLATGTYSVSKEQRLRLAFAGYVANATTQFRPTSGFIITLDGQKHRINLKLLYSTIVSIVDELRKMISAHESVPPKLILNSHCPLCPFRDHCRKEAEDEDNLSLLGKMTQKIIRRYEKKGIFTVKQLSYVFNPRRRRKKSVAANSVFNLELQALALRTEKIYLHETPLIPTNQVELFLDIEGIPDQCFHYLIGLIAVSKDAIKTYSFWANTHDDEATIFQNFLTVAATYENAPIYHYGNYEPKAFSRIARTHGLNVEAIEKRFVNVNSFIRAYRVVTPSQKRWLFSGRKWDGIPDFGIMKAIR